MVIIDKNTGIYPLGVVSVFYKDMKVKTLNLS